MARIDVSDLLLDPDFLDTVTLIRRSIAVDGNGEGVLTETPSSVKMCVQGANTETLLRMPEGARLSDIVTVYYRGVLTAESAGGYADIIVWGGKRYQVKEVPEDFMNYGNGFTMANCLLESVNA